MGCMDRLQDHKKFKRSTAGPWRPTDERQNSLQHLHLRHPRREPLWGAETNLYPAFTLHFYFDIPITKSSLDNALFDHISLTPILSTIRHNLLFLHHFLREIYFTKSQIRDPHCVECSFLFLDPGKIINLDSTFGRNPDTLFYPSKFFYLSFSPKMPSTYKKACIFVKYPNWPLEACKLAKKNRLRFHFLGNCPNINCNKSLYNPNP